jgi:dihydroorotase
MSKKMNIVKPFDGHLHLRVGEMAHLVTPMSAKQFSDVVIMPNLQPPIKTVDDAMNYRKKLVDYDSTCNYHMTLYLTESTTIEEIQKVSDNKDILGFKLYPLNATTGSQDGISDLKKVYHLFEAMEKLRVPLMIHGEVTRPEIDIFDREKVFIEEVLIDIVEKFPKLKITLEHITTEDAVQFVMNNDIKATITAHHLMINRNAIFTVGEKTALNPHNF